MQVVSDDELVSVVIPVKDRPLELRRAVQSVLSQTYNNIEIIIVENNSRNPEAVIEAVNSINSEVVSLYHLDPCENTNVARNFGVSKSRGTVIAFLDSDDEYEVDHIATCIEVAHRANCDFIFGSIKVDSGEGTKVNLARDLAPGEDGLNYLFGRNRAWAQTSTYMCRKSVFRKVLWDETLKRHQDFDFFIRVVAGFTSACNVKPTVIVHWKKGEKRDIDFDSYESFARKWVPSMNVYSAIFFCAYKVKSCFVEGSINRSWIYIKLLSKRLLKLA